MEKIFKFYESNDGYGESTLIEIKESKLSDDQIENITGNFLYEFDKLPIKSQAKVANYIIDLTLRNENFKITYK